jgi:hypothetical protein
VTLEESLSFIRAEESPILIVSDTLHKKVRHPKGIKEVSRTLFLFTMIFLELKEIKDVCMPGLKVDGKGTLTLPTTLVNIPGCLIEHLKHGNQTIGYSIGAFDVRTGRPNAVHSQANTSSGFGNKSCIFQSVINAMYGVIFHC